MHISGMFVSKTHNRVAIQFLCMLFVKLQTQTDALINKRERNC